MLLAIDIGNTNITLGVFDDRELLGKFRMTTMMVKNFREIWYYAKRAFKESEYESRMN